MSTLQLKHEQMLYPTVRVRGQKAGGSGTVIYSASDAGGKFHTIVGTCEHVVDDLIKIEKKWDSVAKVDRRMEILGKGSVEFFYYEHLSRCKGSSGQHRAEIIAYDKDEDIAIMEIERAETSIEYIANLYPRDEIENIHVLDELFCVGAAMGHEPICTNGTLSFMDEEIDGKELWMSTAQSIFGNSGGSVYRYSEERERYEFLGMPARITIAMYGWSADAICYSDDTEVLTDSGWKLFQEVAYADKLATLSSDGVIEYQEPVELVDVLYKGDLLHFKGTKFDLKVTPNHNVYASHYSRTEQSDFRHYRADRLERGTWRLKRDGVWKGEYRESFTIPEYQKTWQSGMDYHIEKSFNKPEVLLPMDAWLRFLGYYVSEGCSQNHQVTITQNPSSPEYKPILESLESLGFPYKIYNREDHIIIHDVQLASYLREICGEGSLNKRTPDFVKSLCPAQIEIYLDSLLGGDGYRAAEVYTTSSKRLANDIQELLLKIELSGNIHVIPEKSSFNGSYISKETYQISTLRFNEPWMFCWKHVTRESYEGHVYCALVPNHTLYVRRNGTPVWSGNTHMGYFVPITRIYELLERNHLEFIYDPTKTYEECMEEREAEQDKERRLILAQVGELELESERT